MGSNGAYNVRESSEFLRSIGRSLYNFAAVSLPGTSYHMVIDPGVGFD